MPNLLTRRDLLSLAGGSALGLFLSPVPWKLLDDSAIWTQNWSLTPKLPRGPIGYRHTHCTLCPGGCGVKARCVHGLPVSLKGTAGHPRNYGVLCPLGYTAHHLSCHPLRLTQPSRFDGKGPDSRLRQSSLEEILSELTGNPGSAPASSRPGTVAIVEERPGRTLSHIYREFLSRVPGSYYVAAPANEEVTLDHIGQMSSSPSWGFDLENSKTILSFGAPLLDEWGTPGRLTRRFFPQTDRDLFLIQVESRRSRTAQQADRYLPLRPGREGILAMGLAQEIIKNNLYPREIPSGQSDWAEFQEMASSFPLPLVAEKTGIAADEIVETARRLAHSSSVVLAGCDPAGGPLDASANRAIACLNVLLGTVGKPGGILPRKEIPGVDTTAITATPLAAIPDYSLHWMLVDSTGSGSVYPMSLLRRKLIPESGKLIYFSTNLTSSAAYADYLIPISASLESLEEVITPPGASTASWSLSVPLMPAKLPSVEPAFFLHKMAEAMKIQDIHFPSAEERFRQRARDIHASERGTVFSPEKETPVKVSDLAQAEELWALLAEGGCWIDDPSPVDMANRFSLGRGMQLWRERCVTQITNTTPSADKLLLIPMGGRGALDTGSVAPILSKLYQESDLRLQGSRILMHPETAAEQGIVSGDNVILHTEIGQAPVIVETDPSIMPGVIYGIVGPESDFPIAGKKPQKQALQAICSLQADGSWRITEARITKV